MDVKYFNVACPKNKTKKAAMAEKDVRHVLARQCVLVHCPCFDQCCSHQLAVHAGAFPMQISFFEVPDGSLFLSVLERKSPVPTAFFCRDVCLPIFRDIKFFNKINIL